MKVENGDAIAQVVLDAQIGVRCPPLGGQSSQHTPSSLHLQPQKFISYSQLDLFPGLKVISVIIRILGK